MHPLSLTVRPYSPPVQATRFLGGQQANPYEELDRALAKTDTHSFKRLVALQFNRAKQHIEQELLIKGKKGFVVLDVDETVLDNREYYRDPHSQYYRKPHKSHWWETWDKWVEEGRAPAIPQAKKFIKWLETNKIPYCYVTGRLKKQQRITMINLKKAGVIGKNCLGVFCKPNEWWVGTTATQKMALRNSLEKQFGMPIVAAIGDLPPDLTGIPEKDFLLPTSQYYPPRT